MGRVSHRFTLYTTLPADVFLGRWPLITAVLFGLFAVALLIRMGRSRPPGQTLSEAHSRGTPREPGKSGPEPE